MAYTFINLPNRKFVVHEDATVQGLLRKWSMLGRLTCHAFTFDQPFHEYDLRKFIESAVSSPAVAEVLQVWRGQHKSTLGRGARVESVVEVPCSLTSMGVLRKVVGGVVAGEDGRINKCPEIYHEDLIIDDNLKKVLVLNDDQVFSETERQELLLRLFRLVALGGECCQFEDNIHTYLAVTRTLYRDLLSPVVEDGRVAVRSMAAQVTLKTAEGTCVPEEQENSQNVLLMVVNSHARTLITLLHQHGIGDMD